MSFLRGNLRNSVCHTNEKSKFKKTEISKLQEKKNEEFYYENLIVKNYYQSIDEITVKIDTTDEILNPFALKEIFHANGLNMRFEWIVYSKLRNSRSKLIIYFFFKKY